MDGPGRRKATGKTCMQMESGKFHLKDNSKGKEQEVVGCMNNSETSCTTYIISFRGTAMHHMHWMLHSLVYRGANPRGTDLVDIGGLLFCSRSKSTTSFLVISSKLSTALQPSSFSSSHGMQCCTHSWHARRGGLANPFASK